MMAAEEGALARAVHSVKESPDGVAEVLYGDARCVLCPPLLSSSCCNGKPDLLEEVDDEAAQSSRAASRLTLRRLVRKARQCVIATPLRTLQNREALAAPENSHIISSAVVPHSALLWLQTTTRFFKAMQSHCAACQIQHCSCKDARPPVLHQPPYRFRPQASSLRCSRPRLLLHSITKDVAWHLTSEYTSTDLH